eukprot:COSAG02_NODE_210_length_28878_cov_133.787136_14_plen_195_part_00
MVAVKISYRQVRRYMERARRNSTNTARAASTRAGDIMNRCFWQGRRSNEDSRGKERNLPKAFYISLTLDWFWNPRTKFWARTRSSFFTEVNSHHHPAYPSLNLPRDRGTHQPILLWNCYVTAAPALQIWPRKISRMNSYNYWRAWNREVSTGILQIEGGQRRFSRLMAIRVGSVKTAKDLNLEWSSLANFEVSP